MYNAAQKKEKKGKTPNGFRVILLNKKYKDRNREINKNFAAFSEQKHTDYISRQSSRRTRKTYNV